MCLSVYGIIGIVLGLSVWILITLVVSYVLRLTKIVWLYDSYDGRQYWMKHSTCGGYSGCISKAESINNLCWLVSAFAGWIVDRRWMRKEMDR